MYLIPIFETEAEIELEIDSLSIPRLVLQVLDGNWQLQKNINLPYIENSTGPKVVTQTVTQIWIK